MSFEEPNEPEYDVAVAVYCEPHPGPYITAIRVTRSDDPSLVFECIGPCGNGSAHAAAIEGICFALAKTEDKNGPVTIRLCQKTAVNEMNGAAQFRQGLKVVYTPVATDHPNLMAAREFVRKQFELSRMGRLR